MKDIIVDEAQLGNRADEIDIRKEGKVLQATVLDLKEIIREKNLKGLSAPQIGVPIRVFCLNFGETVKTFVNPTITKATGFALSREKTTSSAFISRPLWNLTPLRRWKTYWVSPEISQFSASSEWYSPSLLTDTSCS